MSSSIKLSSSNKPSIKSTSKSIKESVLTIPSHQISKTINEADRISYTQAILILLSVAFGVGYLDVFHAENGV